MKNINKTFLFGTITIIWVAIIFSFSLQPGEVSSEISSSFGRKILEWFVPSILDKLETMPQEQLDMWHLFFRKCAHFTEFLILGVLSSLTVKQTKRPHKILVAIAFCVVVAATDETIQLFVSDRAGRLQDVLIDSAGAVCGIGVVSLLREMKRRK